MDFDLTPGKHAQCPNSPPAQFSGKGQMFLGALPSFFLQSRPVVLDWVHTPGEHAQCHKTRNSHIENFHFLFGLMAAGPLLHSRQDSMISL